MEHVLAASLTRSGIVRLSEQLPQQTVIGYTLSSALNESLTLRP